MQYTASGPDLRSNADLLAAYWAGETEAFGVFALRILPSLLSAMQAHLALRGRAEWAEEICQESILRAIMHMKRRREKKQAVPPNLHAGWFVRVGVNIARDRLRSERTASTVKKLLADKHNFTATAEAEVERRHVREQARALISQLPAQEAILMRSIYVSGLSRGEAGNKLGLSPAATHKRHARALSRLRELLANDVRLARRIFGPE